MTLKHRIPDSIKGDGRISRADYGEDDNHRLLDQETGDIIYGASRQSLTRLAIGSTGERLAVASTGLPEWTDTASADQFIADGFGLIIGHTAQLSVSTGDGSTALTPEFQVIGTGQPDSSILLAAFSATATRAAAPTLAFVKGGAATVAVGTAVTDDEVLGNIIAYGDDGTDIESPAAAIQFVVNGTPGTGDMPGSIEFYTTVSGGETLTLAWTINAAGELLSAGSGFDLDMAGAGVISNVGASGNNLGANLWELNNANDGADNIIASRNTNGTAGSDGMFVAEAASAGGDPGFSLLIAGDTQFTYGLDNSASDIATWSASAHIGVNNRMTLAVSTGILSVDGDGGGSDDPVLLFDDDDDALMLREIAHSLADVDGKTAEERDAFRDLLVQKGIGSWAPQSAGPDRILLTIQGMWALHSGGVYQNRGYIDSVAADVQALRQEMRALTAGPEVPHG